MDAQVDLDKEEQELEQLEEVMRDDRATTWIGVGLVIGAAAGLALGVVMGNMNLGVVFGSIGGALVGAGVGKMQR